MCVRFSILLLMVFIDVVWVVIICGVWCNVDLKLLYLILIRVVCLEIGVSDSFVFVINISDFLDLVMRWFMLISDCFLL